MPVKVYGTDKSTTARGVVYVKLAVEPSLTEDLLEVSDGEMDGGAAVVIKS